MQRVREIAVSLRGAYEARDGERRGKSVVAVADVRAAPAHVEARHELAERPEIDHRPHEAGLAGLARLRIQSRKKFEPFVLYHTRYDGQSAAHPCRGIFLVADERRDDVDVEERPVRRELFYKRRLERDAALHVHDAASVERIFVRAENFAELVSVEGVFRDVAVDGHVHDVVVAHHEHRALRRLRRVDARDEGLQRVRRALERRLRRYQMRGVFREVGQLFEPRAKPRAGRALLGALRDARYRDELFYH